VLVIADGRFGDAGVIQKLAGLARVLAGDQVGFTQRAKGAKRDVFEVADGGRDDVENAHVLFWRTAGRPRPVVYASLSPTTAADALAIS
jgi:hypothetical protein